MITLLRKILPQSFRSRCRQKWNEIKFQSDISWGKFTRLFVRPPLPKVEDVGVNLHLGCGSINHPKFINVDGIPAPHIHYVRNINDLSPFKDESVDLIYASHCLEHFPHAVIQKMLEEWYIKLKKNGILRLSVPDFDLLLYIYKENHNNLDTIILPLFGGQDYKFNFHKTIFTKSSLTTLLKNAGFRDVCEWKHGLTDLTSFDDWSGRKITINSKEYFVSLNIEAIK